MDIDHDLSLQKDCICSVHAKWQAPMTRLCCKQSCTQNLSDLYSTLLSHQICAKEPRGSSAVVLCLMRYLWHAVLLLLIPLCWCRC